MGPQEYFQNAGVLVVLVAPGFTTQKMNLHSIGDLYSYIFLRHQIDGLVQERRNSSALAMELHLSRTNPSERLEVLCHFPLCQDRCELRPKYGQTLSSVATWLSVWYLIKDNNQESMKALRYCPF